MLKFSSHSRRVRKIWYSILATILGTAFLVSLILWQTRQFDTDLADPTAGITASAKTESTLDSPPIRFQDVGESMGLPGSPKPDKRKRLLPEDTGSGLAWGDYDGDGDWDLYVNNDVSTNKLFRNMLGDLQSDAKTDSIAFTDLSSITGTADPRGSMGLSVGELGRMNGKPDGLPDLFITHWVAQENAFYQSLRMPGGSLEYRDKTRQFRLGEISIDTVGWGTALIDLDLDGRTDLVVANGSTLEQPDQPAELIAEPLFLFWNSGNRFQNVAASAGQTAAGKHSARGLAAADFDDDGDIDLAIAINRSGPLLLRNETPTANHFLKIRLRGSAAARFGASVEIFTGEESQKMWYGADASFLSMHAPELIFGLGSETSVDRLIVEWADGKQSTLRQLEPGRVEVVHPGDRQISPKRSTGRALTPGQSVEKLRPSRAGRWTTKRRTE